MTPQLQSFLSAFRPNTAEYPVQVPASRNDLCRFFRTMGYTRGAEIGVWQGRFSESMCKANPGVKLICVDPWKWYGDYKDPKNVPERIEQAKNEAHRRLIPLGCEIKVMASTEGADTVPDGSLDYAYIDANHAEEYVYADLVAWEPKVRSGGIVAGHDYEVRRYHAHLHVRPAVDRFTRERGINPFYVLIGDKSPSFFWVKP